MTERILNSNLDAGAGFELTESDFKNLGEKQSHLLSIHKYGTLRRVNPEETEVGGWKELSMLPRTQAWFKKRGFDPFAK